MNHQSTQERKNYPTYYRSFEYTEVINFIHTQTTSRGIHLKYFMSFNFRKPSKKYFQQYCQNAHIKAIILRFLYGKNIPKSNRVKLFFFVEKSRYDRTLHTHLLMESLCTRSMDRMLRRMNYNGDKIFLPSIRDTDGIITNEYFEGLILNRMMDTIKNNTSALGTGKQSTDVRLIGDEMLRINYCTKEVNMKTRYSNKVYDWFDCVDVVNSDLSPIE